MIAAYGLSIIAFIIGVIVGDWNASEGKNTNGSQ